MVILRTRIFYYSADFAKGNSFRLFVKLDQHQALFYRSAYYFSLESGFFIVLLNRFCVKSECTK